MNKQQTNNLAIEAMVRDNIDVREMGLTLVGMEYSTPLGRIDILAADGDGNKIPIEIKIGTAGDSAIGQVLGYMEAIGATEGIIMANDFTKRAKAVAGSYNIELYPYYLNVVTPERSAFAQSLFDYNDYLSDHVYEDMFIRKYCDVEPGRMIAAQVLDTVFNRWVSYNYGHCIAGSHQCMLESFLQTQYGTHTIEVDVGDNKGDSWIAGTLPCTSPSAYNGICLKHTLGNIHVDLSYIDEHWDELGIWD